MQTTRQYLAFLMTGQREEPRLSLVEALADVFGVPAATNFTADYLGRVASDLLPLLAAMHDQSTPHPCPDHPADLAEAAATLAEARRRRLPGPPPAADVLAALAHPTAQAAVSQAIASRAASGAGR